MEIHKYTLTSKNVNNGGYVSIDDPGGDNIHRVLIIKDDEGNLVKLENEQIGELYKKIKPIFSG